MIYRISQVLFAMVVLAGCCTGSSPIESAGADYMHNRDYASLETVSNSFHKGMQRSEVERLLGAPDYSPTDGQYYYSSDRSVDSEDQGRSVAAGLVVDYRDENGNVTDRLHQFRLGPIGE